MSNYITKRLGEIRVHASFNDLSSPDLDNHVLGTGENGTVVGLSGEPENGRGDRKLEAGKCHCCF